MAVTLANLKEYLRIDIDAEDTLLTQCLSAADAYLNNAITDYATNYAAAAKFAAQADMVWMALAAEMYQNRDSRNDNRTHYSYMIRSMITQLQYWVGDTT